MPHRSSTDTQASFPCRQSTSLSLSLPAALPSCRRGGDALFQTSTITWPEEKSSYRREWCFEGSRALYRSLLLWPSPRRGGTETNARLAVDDSNNAMFHQCLTEVQQIPKLHSRVDNQRPSLFPFPPLFRAAGEAVMRFSKRPRSRGPRRRVATVGSGVSRAHGHCIVRSFFGPHRGAEARRRMHGSPWMIRIMPCFINASPKFNRYPSFIPVSTINVPLSFPSRRSSELQARR